METLSDGKMVDFFFWISLHVSNNHGDHNLFYFKAHLNINSIRNKLVNLRANSYITPNRV